MQQAPQLPIQAHDNSMESGCLSFGAQDGSAVIPPPDGSDDAPACARVMRGALVLLAVLQQVDPQLVSEDHGETKSVSLKVLMGSL